MSFTIELASPAPLTIPVGLPGLLRDLVLEHTGIHFDSARLDVLLEKLGDLVRARGFNSYMEYYYLLKYEDRDRREWQRVIEALSVQETYFWREMSQVRALVEVVVPQWFAAGGKPLRIWSSACASGEEPYTIEIALLEAGFGDYPIEILASDASEAAVEKARRAVYRERAFRSLPADLRRRYFREEADGNHLDRSVADRVSFHRANLLDRREIASMVTAQVHFCRNVFIYFAPETIRRALYQFAGGMPDGAHLFVGVSESLLKLTDQFELREIGDAFVYVRRPRNGGRGA